MKVGEPVGGLRENIRPWSARLRAQTCSGLFQGGIDRFPRLRTCSTGRGKQFVNMGFGFDEQNIAGIRPAERIPMGAAAWPETFKLVGQSLGADPPQEGSVRIFGEVVIRSRRAP